jgi:hypothetical protein
LVIDILEVKDFTSIALISGVMVCNPTVISTNSAFLQVVDFYCLALFLSILGVWLCKRADAVGIVGGIIAMAVSMGIYQSYICVSIALLMILLLKKVYDGKFSFKEVVLYCVSLLVAAVLFYVTWKVFLKIFGIWTADTYNGMAGLWDFSIGDIPALIGLTYKNVFTYFWNPDTFTTMVFHEKSLSVVWLYLLRVVNIFIVAKILVNIFAGGLKSMLNVFILILFPLGMNFVCIMSKGMEHTLMIYAFVFMYILAVCVSETAFAAKGRIIPKIGLIVCILCVIWSNVVYANQTYLKKDLQDKAMTSLMTRIVSDIEDMDGYEAGVTPVAFYGSFEASDYVQELYGFEDVLPYGMGKSSLTYVGTEQALLKYVLNVPMNLVSLSEEDDTITKMPTYPTNGSIEYVGDVLVVKISE